MTGHLAKRLMEFDIVGKEDRPFIRLMPRSDNPGEKGAYGDSNKKRYR